MYNFRFKGQLNLKVCFNYWDWLFDNFLFLSRAVIMGTEIDFSITEKGV